MNNNHNNLPLPPPPPTSDPNMKGPRILVPESLESAPLANPTMNYTQFQDSVPKQRPTLQLANLDRSTSDGSFPNSPVAMLPRPKLDKNLNSPSAPRHTPTALSRKLSSRIDPTQIPRPGKDYQETIFHTRSSTSRKNPPSVNTHFVSVDNGNCFPSHLRSSLVAPPCNRDVAKKVELPYAIVATPFAELKPGEEEIPRVFMENTNNRFPPRCSRCSGYINPSVEFIDEGKQWVCNLCQSKNTVEDWYFSRLDASCQRTDRLSRPELTRGSVEFLLNESETETGNGNKLLHPPRALIFSFEMSNEAVQRGVTAAAIAAIRKTVIGLRRSWEEENEITTVPSQSSQSSSFFQPGLSSAPPGIPSLPPSLGFPPGPGSGNNTSSGPPAPPNYYQQQSTGYNSEREKKTTTARTTTSSSSVVDYRIGIIGFSSHLCFFDVRKLPKPTDADTDTEMIDHCDDSVELLFAESVDPFAALPPNKWLFSLSDSDQWQRLEHLLARLPHLVQREFINSQNNQNQNRFPNISRPMNSSSFSSSFSSCCLSAVVKGVADSLTIQTNPSKNNPNPSVSNYSVGGNGPALGGKLFFFSSNHSTTGFGTHSRSATRTRDYLYGQPEECLMYVSPPPQSSSSSSNSNNSMNMSVALPDSLLNSSHSKRYYSSETRNNPNSNNNNNKTTIDRKEEISALFDLHSQLATDLIQRNLSVSGFFFTEGQGHGQGQGPDQFQSVETTFLGEIIQRTGGKLFLQRDFSPSLVRSDSNAVVSSIASQLETEIRRSAGSDSQWKLRTSSSLKVTGVIAAGSFDPLSEVLSLPEVTRDSTALFDLKIVSDSPDEEKIHCQLAVLYTDNHRYRYPQRVVRVHNYTMISSNKGSVIFRNCDVEVIAAWFAKVAARKALTAPLTDPENGPRPFLEKKLLEVFSQYRKLCASISTGNMAQVASPKGKGQLILPEALKTLPMYTLGMLKHSILFDNNILGNNTSPLALLNNRNNNNKGITTSTSSTSLAQPPPPRSSTSLPHSSSSSALPTTPSSSFYSGQFSPSPMAAKAAGVVRPLAIQDPLFVSCNERYFELLKMIHLPIREVINSCYPRLYSLFAVLERSLFFSSLVVDETIPSSSSSSLLYDENNNNNNIPGGGGMGGMLYGNNNNNNNNNNTGLGMMGMGSLIFQQPFSSPSFEHFESDQIYLLDDRSFVWIFVGRSVSQEVIEELFSFDDDNNDNNNSTNNRYNSQSHSHSVTGGQYSPAPASLSQSRPEVGVKMNNTTKLGKAAETFIEELMRDGPFRPGESFSSSLLFLLLLSFSFHKQ
jgi:hypothetical protein